MKLNKTRRASAGSGVGRKSPINSSYGINNLDYSIFLQRSSGVNTAEAAEEVETVSNITNINTGLHHLFQDNKEINDYNDKKKKLIQYGHNLLREMNLIYQGLLNNSINKTKLLEIADEITANKHQVTDPRLLSIIEKIELRTMVELTKLGITPREKASHIDANELLRTNKNNFKL